MINAPFTPMGSTYLVVATAIQVLAAPTGGVCSSFRVRNLSTTPAYFTWGPTSGTTSAGAPIANTPSANTIGMLGSSVEVFTLPATAYFIANNATGFEFTPGEGV